MGGAFSSDDNDNTENEQLMDKSIHQRVGTKQRRNRNKNTTSKNKPKKNVSFSDEIDDLENDDNDNDDNKPLENDSNDNVYDFMIEPIVKKRKPRKQSANSTKKRRYN